MMKQNPFSLYDFLGYLLPGLAFLICGAWLFGSVDKLSTLSLSAELSIAAVLAGYIIGHTLALLSAITVEKFLVFTIGYPSSFLLGRKPRRASLLKIVPLGAGLLPIGFYWLCQLLFDHRLIAKPLQSKPLISAIDRKLEKLRRRMGFDEIDVPTGSDSDFFRPVYHYALEAAPNHQAKMQNYVALYGFLRSLSFASCCLMWAGAVMWWQAKVDWWFPTLAFFSSMLFYYGFAKFYRRFSLEALMAFLVCDLSTP